MHSLLHACAISLVLATAACAGGSGSGNPGPDSGTKVRIENRSTSDMDIYVRPTLSRPIRLGFVPASDTAEFALARALLAGSAGFHLEARPVARPASQCSANPGAPLRDQDGPGTMRPPDCRECSRARRV